MDKKGLLWDKLLEHEGHDVGIVWYQDESGQPVNVSLEDNDTGEVVFDTDIYELIGVATDKDKISAILMLLRDLLETNKDDTEMDYVEEDLYNEMKNLEDAISNYLFS